MDFYETFMEGLFVLTPKIYDDKRGYFYESFNQNIFKEKGLPFNCVQENESFSYKNTVRGLHFQKPPFVQAKLIRVVKGAIWDVALDLRKESKTFGRWFGVELSKENKKQLFIPHGFAHGFSVLSDTAITLYQCDSFYNEKSQGAITFDDKELNIDWKIDLSKAILSEKDLNNLSFSDYKERPCF